MESPTCPCTIGLLTFARAVARGASRSRFAFAFSFDSAGRLTFFAAEPPARAEPAHRPCVNTCERTGQGDRSSSHAYASVNGRPANSPAPDITIAKHRRVIMHPPFAYSA